MSEETWKQRVAKGVRYSGPSVTVTAPQTLTLGTPLDPVLKAKVDAQKAKAKEKNPWLK